jgi:SAM-dependent methyltransferase
MDRRSRKGTQTRTRDLPDLYRTVGEDVIAYMGRSDGIWLDIGSGPGGLGLAVASRTAGIVVLVDPDAASLARAQVEAARRGLAHRVVPIVGRVEALPMPDGSVDAIMSRGSFYFWQDRAQGLREIHRVLRPGGKAMIGGGLGRRYPAWARREFIRRRREAVERNGPEAVQQFREARRPETFRRLAVEAGLTAFEIIGEGGLGADDPQAGVGIWLRYTKEPTT